MSNKLFECMVGNRFRMKIVENVPLQSPEEKEKSYLISQISDDYKSLHGMRPRMIKYDELSIEELRQIADELSQNIHDMLERERNDEKQHQSATQNAMTPKKWTVGDITGLEEIHPEDTAEEHGDGYRNDAQRAFAHAQTTHGPTEDDTEKAKALAAQGKYVVISINNMHDKATDAVLGQHVSIESVHPNSQEAEKAAAALVGHSDGVNIVSPESVKSTAQPANDVVDDVPFECVGGNTFKLK